MPVIIQNQITINCPTDALYNYVTQPWLWHEWHPNSKSAEASVDKLSVGDAFEEEVELQPLSPLPITMRRHTKYVVLADKTNSLWEVEGKMKDGWLKIRYEFTSNASTTNFDRTLTFDAKGLSRLMIPLLRKRMEAKSLEALHNLKNKLEKTQ